ncbi:MAG: spore coat U domain-containing protein [Myxococcota bacterium]|nr:spore coat U domain-containing protein [Myxococcota bacterium]
MRLAGILTVLLLAARPAAAGVCSVTSVAPVTFGTYDVFATAPLTFAGSVTYACTDVAPSEVVVISIDGLPSGGGPRTLVGATSSLAYQLYLDAARTVVWGDGTGGSATYGPLVPVAGSPTVVPIYGRLPSRQDVPAGAYAASLVVTLNL